MAKSEKVKVTVKVGYFDIELNKEMHIGDTIEVSPKRAIVLKEKGLVK